MKIGELKDLKCDIVKLHKFCNGGAERTEHGNVDKVGTGFNVDGRRMMCGKHVVWYDTRIGYYGNSNASSQIELHESSHALFWKCFDEYLNENEDAILNAVCNKMAREMRKQQDVVEEEIKRLRDMMDEINEIGNE